MHIKHIKNKRICLNLPTVKLTPFLYSSMSFNKCFESCNHHYNQDTQQFHHLAGTPLCYPPPSSQTLPEHLPLVTTDLVPSL